jgi:hypothetical protein
MADVFGGNRRQRSLCWRSPSLRQPHVDYGIDDDADTLTLFRRYLQGIIMSCRGNDQVEIGRRSQNAARRDHLTYSCPKGRWTAQTAQDRAGDGADTVIFCSVLSSRAGGWLWGQPGAAKPISEEALLRALERVLATQHSRSDRFEHRANSSPLWQLQPLRHAPPAAFAMVTLPSKQSRAVMIAMARAPALVARIAMVCSQSHLGHHQINDTMSGRSPSAMISRACTRWRHEPAVGGASRRDHLDQPQGLGSSSTSSRSFASAFHDAHNGHHASVDTGLLR